MSVGPPNWGVAFVQLVRWLPRSLAPRLGARGGAEADGIPQAGGAEAGGREGLQAVLAQRPPKKRRGRRGGGGG